VADPNKDIPQESRDLVTERERGLCFLCRGRGRDWHHRRSRRVRTMHRHCPCNGVLLCRTCHTAAHREPERSRVNGLLVSQWMDEPFAVPVMDAHGWWQLLCNGKYVPLKLNDIITDGVGGFVVSILDTDTHSGVQ
jgi:hypothetical protein